MYLKGMVVWRRAVAHATEQWCVYWATLRVVAMAEATSETIVEPSWGSWKVHAVLLILTFGTGNVVYGVYRRYINPKTRTVGENDAGTHVDADVPYGTLSDLEPSARANIEDLLLDDESFILGIRAADRLRKSRKTRWILTDRRVVSVREGMVSETFRDIPLSNISSVEYDQGATTEVSFSGSGVDEEFYTAPAQGKAFVNALREELLKN